MQAADSGAPVHQSFVQSAKRRSQTAWYSARSTGQPLPVVRDVQAQFGNRTAVSEECSSECMSDLASASFTPELGRSAWSFTH